MTLAEEYIASVIDQMPRGTPMRSQIADELRGHIAERVGQGATVEDVLRNLGDPEKLAESYLAAVRLESAGVGPRTAAKIIDFLVCLVILAPALAVCYLVFPPETYYMPLYFWICIAILLGGGCVMTIYGVVAEYQSGATIGKRAMGCRVVREKGTRITLGQAIVRHLPFVMQVIWVDALFALFTEHKQRAFELLSRTRVVLVSTEEAK